MDEKEDYHNKEEFFRTLLPDDVRKAMDGLLMGFTWSYSRQGTEYWAEVYDNLREMLRDREAFDRPTLHS